mmetsp:Transcript_10537/g.22888  ORF Transcript_10537/g.22888 Transcript_10537/m.22888 type:complete len:213 (+) Transcript_10537:429-1067(+)
MGGKCNRRSLHHHGCSWTEDSNCRPRGRRHRPGRDPHADAKGLSLGQPRDGHSGRNLDHGQARNDVGIVRSCSPRRPAAAAAADRTGTAPRGRSRSSPRPVGPPRQTRRTARRARGRPAAADRTGTAPQGRSRSSPRSVGLPRRARGHRHPTRIPLGGARHVGSPRQGGSDRTHGSGRHRGGSPRQGRGSPRQGHGSGRRVGIEGESAVLLC